MQLAVLILQRKCRSFLSRFDEVVSVKWWKSNDVITG